MYIDDSNLPKKQSEEHYSPSSPPSVAENSELSISAAYLEHSFLLHMFFAKESIYIRWHDLVGHIYAHFPSNAIKAAPRKTQAIMKNNRLLSLVLMGLKRKSLANNSTNPV